MEIIGFCLFIIAYSFLLEDAAILLAAGFAAQGTLPIYWAFISIFLGIILGDYALFGLGLWAQKSQRIRNWVQKIKADKVKEHFKKNIFILLLTSRFIPGMRLPTYVGAGYFNVSFKLFFLFVIPIVGLWTSIIFVTFFMIGRTIEDYLSTKNMIIVALGILLFYYGIAFIRKTLKK